MINIICQAVPHGWLLLLFIYEKQHFCNYNNQPTPTQSIVIVAKHFVSHQFDEQQPLVWYIEELRYKQSVSTNTKHRFAIIILSIHLSGVERKNIPYLQFDFLEVYKSDIWKLVDDVQTVMFLCGYWITHQTVIITPQTVIIKVTITE